MSDDYVDLSDNYDALLESDVDNQMIMSTCQIFMSTCHIYVELTENNYHVYELSILL